ncbi:unnamed protein product [Closterium sp. Yama58-4]|nr:unnamed protein product [Closterium sp. Yama58-4]
MQSARSTGGNAPTSSIVVAVPVLGECPPRQETTAPRGTNRAAGQEEERREQTAPEMLEGAEVVDRRREDLAAGGTQPGGTPGVALVEAEKEAATDPPVGGEAAKETVAPAGGEAAGETAAPVGGEAAEEIAAVLPADAADELARDSAVAEGGRGLETDAVHGGMGVPSREESDIDVVALRATRGRRPQPAPRRLGAALAPGQPGPLHGWLRQEQSPQQQAPRPPSPSAPPAGEAAIAMTQRAQRRER